MPADPLTASLALALGLGLAGSVHCLGMCGGFALALGQMPGRAGAALARYFAGKTLAYAALGLLAGAFGGALAAALGPLQHVLSWALGLALVGVGLSLSGLARPSRRLAWTPDLTRALGWALRLPPRRAAWTLGLLNGLLPCGLVYAMLALAAATGSAASGAAVMAVFGVSTLPALGLAGLLGAAARPLWRARVTRLAGVVMILMGGWTVVRGLPAVPDAPLVDAYHSERVALDGADEAMCR